ncbi:MAG: ATP-dependent RecD-like DNA helicase [Kiritimatiellae bacterium]|nr:ATP-dependent RecD-like DNA helicase [Kiritimatiellia bacterium]
MNAPPSNNAETVSGTVQRIIYRDENTAYTVCSLKPDAGHDEITVVGASAAIWPGERLQVSGRWTRHKTHGVQFNADKIVCIEPRTVSGIKKYLASGLIKGVGEMLAERLVKKFGTDTLRVIDEESARLESVEGIGRRKRERIRQSWLEQKAVRDIMIFLHANGVSASQATRIYNAYGDNAVAVLRQNPYRLAADIWGIGFKSADKIAMNMGIPMQSVVRARAGLAYMLQTMAEEGHCYCGKDELLAGTGEQLEIGFNLLEEALGLELAAGNLISENTEIYMPALYYSETGCASNLKRLQEDSVSNAGRIKAASAVEWAAGRMKISFSPAQAAALNMAINEKVGIITGGPGVGKTTIIKALVDIFSAKKMAVRLAAPTGRAAKRMEEATGHQATTIHRLLKFQPGLERFEYGADKRLEGDVFILDEVSMIDVVLMNCFLRALPGRARLLLIGDADQLPSVGPGNVLRDLIDSGAFPAIKLDKIFRQSEKSLIVRNAHLVNSGRFFELGGDGENDFIRDFYFIEENEPAQVVARMLELVAERIPRRFRMSPRTDIQVLTPMRRFELGADNLNAVLQGAINPRGEGIVSFGRTYRAGDRVMQMRNNYDKDVYNGDIGLIRSVNHEDQQVIIDYDGREVVYDFSEMDEINLAYASSIHKAQGSEYPAVIILLTTQHFKLLQRNLLYTALTRGRKLVCLVGSRKAAAIAIHNNHTAARRTGLKQRLSGRNII